MPEHHPVICPNSSVPRTLLGVDGGTATGPVVQPAAKDSFRKRGEVVAGWLGGEWVG